MLEYYGLNNLIWNTCDERFGDVLVASPADAGGRGIAFTFINNGTAIAAKVFVDTEVRISM